MKLHMSSALLVLGYLFTASSCLAMNWAERDQKLRQLEKLGNEIEDALDKRDQKRAIEGLTCLSGENEENDDQVSNYIHDLKVRLFYEAVANECYDVCENEVLKRYSPGAANYALRNPRSVERPESKRKEILQKIVEKYKVDADTLEFHVLNNDIASPLLRKYLKEVLQKPVVTLRYDLLEIVEEQTDKKDIKKLAKLIEASTLDNFRSALRDIKERLFEWLISANKTDLVRALGEKGINAPTAINPEIMNNASSEMLELIKRYSSSQHLPTNSDLDNTYEGNSTNNTPAVTTDVQLAQTENTDSSQKSSNPPHENKPSVPTELTKENEDNLNSKVHNENNSSNDQLFLTNRRLP